MFIINNTKFLLLLLLFELEFYLFKPGFILINNRYKNAKLLRNIIVIYILLLIILII